LIDLSRRQNVTIFVSTHFMNEALRCDRMSLMHAGTVLACDTPCALMAARGTNDLETAFIGYIADAAGDSLQLGKSESSPLVQPEAGAAAAGHQSDILSPARLLAYSYLEMLEILRDPIRLAFAFVGSVLLMLVFGFGITTDVEHIRYATLDTDQTPDSESYLEAFAST